MIHPEVPTKLEPALYVVATPIGNLRDITLRALDTLKQVDIVAAEDTRNTGQLLQQYSIKPPKLISLHQHNERGMADKIADAITQGQSVALVTDAGTPAVSDPGALLVAALKQAGHKVIPIPGASAVITALSASGQAHPHFLFYGFLPNKSKARQSCLQALSDNQATLVFYEAPHRIVDSVNDMLQVLGGERQITLARELTKLFETIHSCQLSEAPAWLSSDSNQQRGEFVVLIAPAAEDKQQLSANSQLTLKLLLAELPLKQAVQLCSQISGENRNALYQLALTLKQDSENEPN